MILNTIQSDSTGFEGFYKLKCKHKDAEQVRQTIRETLPDCFVFSDKKIQKKKTFFILTGKHTDKLLDVIGKKHFIDIKENIEKIFKEKAKKIDLKDLEKVLKKQK